MRLVYAAAMALVLTACGGAPPPQTGASALPAADDAPSAPWAEARRRRDEAAKLTPPSLPADSSPPAVMSFMKESVPPWVKARRAAVESCVEAFRDAAKQAPAPERSKALLEAAQAAMAFVEAYAHVSNDAASALATDPADKADLLKAFRESEKPHAELAQDVLRECVASDASGAPTEAVDECRAMLAKFSEH